MPRLLRQCFGSKEEDMMRKGWIVFLFGVFFLSLGVMPVQADGIIIPPPCREGGCPPPPCEFEPCPPFPPRPISQLNIRYHRVDVTINDQVATTRVDQVFYNPADYAVEGTYIFPLPLDAVVSDFKLWVDGEPVEGKVLAADEARRVYEEIVNSLRDPALLEYIGRGAVQASVFPIPPKGERRIQLEYNQVLTAEKGLIRYVYPLNTEKFSMKPLEQVAVKVTINSKQPLRAIYSPTHPVDITRQNDQSVVVGWEANNVLPESDFALYYSVGESEAFHLLTYRDPGDPTDPEGFFLMLLAPKPQSSGQAIPKDVILVLDRSGSMEGEKFTQAQEALRFVLRRLNKEDRFHLLTFSTGVNVFANGMRPADEAPEALAWVDQLSSAGSTDINRALLEAISTVGTDRPTYLIFLTDGLPTVGELDSAKILANIGREAPSNLRLFSFGVGYDVDTFLLDSLSSEHHGLSSYVRPDESLEEVLSAFYERISTPVMTDLQIDFGSMHVSDVYPQPMPDLFSGTQTIVVGRYKDGGSTNITIKGQVNGSQTVLEFPEQTFTHDSRTDMSELSALPRLWATRKIGYLLNVIRLKGPDQETIDQIVKLSVRYGIVTPYTSYLVTEPMPLGAAAQEKIAGDAFNNAKASPPAASGQDAFNRAAQEGQLQSAEVAPGSVQNEQAMVRAVGQRTFLLSGGTWMDTSFDPQKMQAEVVPFLSQAYFQLAQSRPDVGAALALGEKVIVVVDGKAYQVGPAGEVQTPEPGQATLTPVVQHPTVAPGIKPTQTVVERTQPGAKSANPACASVVLPLVAVFLWIIFRRGVKVGV
jgi:Ca-activated chloride channel family protein